MRLSGAFVTVLRIFGVMAVVLASSFAEPPRMALADTGPTQMHQCPDCPESHRGTLHARGMISSDGRAPNCHHAVTLVVALLNAALDVPRSEALSFTYDLPPETLGRDRVPERDLPPPRS